MVVFIIKWKDEIVAKSEGEYVIKIDSVKAPWSLFGDKDKVHIITLANWLSDRVFQSNRLDVDNLLRSLDIEEYNVMEIVRKTNAILTGNDEYSVHIIDDVDNIQ